MPRLLATERLLLRSWTEDDATQLRELWKERDRRAARRISDDGRPTVEEMRDRLRQQLADSETTGFRLYAAEHDVDGVIGYCGLVTGQATTEEPELAFELFRRVHGRGYATEAGRAVVAAADASGRHRLWETVREWNTPSLRVLAKLGFEPTGRADPDPERGTSLWLTRSRGDGATR